MKQFLIKSIVFLGLVVIVWSGLPGAVEKQLIPTGGGQDSQIVGGLKPAIKTGQKSTIKVGVYNGDGASPACVIETFEALRIDSRIVPSLIGPAGIYADGLDELDVIIFPGGSGSRQNNSMGSGLHEKIVRFVRERGKGVVGICAGAYLVSDTKDYPCLGLIGADTIDRVHDKRGSALVEVSFTEKGLEIFPEMKDYRYGYIQYHDGPVFVPPSESKNITYSELAINRSDVHHTGNAPQGITPGKSFLLCEEAGKGRVFACAGHPESTTGMRWMVPRMVRWVARMDLAEYSAEVTRPGLGTNEIMHSDELETELYWKLFDEDPAIKIETLRELRKKRYRNGFRWAIGMIRDSDPEVRAFAARVLAEAEYTAAIEGLEAVIGNEKDPICRKQLQSAIDDLKRIVSH
jgi:putative intracellular protease/amidase